jgi:pyruvate dehydrogenase E2 component (dihydrolipoamide acetyltransferase)
MAIEIRLPQLAESMTSGRVSAWLKREGDLVEAGEPIVEVETDKSSVEVAAPASGRLSRILVPAGTDGVKVGGLLAIIGDQDGSGIEAPTDRPVEPQLMPSVAAPAPASATAEVTATPLARKMAAVAGIELAAIAGTGPHGRIGKDDIDRILRARGPGTSSIGGGEPRTDGGVARQREPVRPAAVAPTPQVVTSANFEERSLSAIRRITAARTAHSKQTVPHFYLRIECRVDALLEARARIKASSPDFSPTITDFVVRAAALALIKVPLANSAWVDDTLRVYNAADIAVAVATDEGLLTPIVRGAERKGLAEISSELKALTERARAGTLKPEDYSGGTFTVSNLGMYGLESLFAIVNPPQSCILGVGAAQERPVVRAGALAVGHMMTCTLSADHRAIDGATGAALLAEFQRLIEEPWLLVI